MEALFAVVCSDDDVRGLMMQTLHGITAALADEVRLEARQIEASTSLLLADVSGDEKYPAIYQELAIVTLGVVYKAANGVGWPTTLLGGLPKRCAPIAAYAIAYARLAAIRSAVPRGVPVTVQVVDGISVDFRVGGILGSPRLTDRNVVVGTLAHVTPTTAGRVAEIVPPRGPRRRVFLGDDFNDRFLSRFVVAHLRRVRGARIKWRVSKMHECQPAFEFV